jgi:predicted SAM-dependent methyltransferase
MRTETRLHLGSGGRDIGHSFSNFDMDVPINKPLPWPDNHVEFIVASHVAEHVKPVEAFDFFRECHRILRPGGVVRITVPDLVQAYHRATAAYMAFIKQHGWGEPTRAGVMNSLLRHHTHESAFTAELLLTMLEAAGLDAQYVSTKSSTYPELANSHHHDAQIGAEFDWIESVCCEGVKP